MPAEKPSIARTLRVWDLPTRLYHWIQFVLVVLALVLGFFAPEWLLTQHVIVGFAIIRSGIVSSGVGIFWILLFAFFLVYADTPQA